VDSAKQFLGQWCRKAIASGIKIIQEISKMLLSHKSGILNYFTFKISTGLLEGINNKIKVLKRKIYGFRDFELFKLKIFDLHNCKFDLKGA